MPTGPAAREAASDVTVEPAWRRDDAGLEAEAVAFWNRLGILPKGVAPEQRAKELVAVVRRGGELIGLSTATLDHYTPLGARMAFLRAAVDPGHRRTHAAIALAVGSREIIERWAAEHPAERVGGMLGIVENRDLGPPLLEPYWPTTRLTLIGFTPDGRQVRAYWFPHFRFGEGLADEPRPAAEVPWDVPALDVRKAWRLNDPAVEADAIAYWQRLNLLPEGVTPEARAKELVAAAYSEGQLIAVVTATVEYVDFLRARFAVVRGSTDPDHRRKRAQQALAEPSREALEEWALAHPQEELAGAVAVVSRSEWGPFVDVPVWPANQLMVFSQTPDGRQIRGRWFDHYRLRPPSES